MKKVKVLFLITAVMVTLVIAGCGVVIDVPITPSTGPIRICTNSPSIYGNLYVDNSSWDIIDGANVVGTSCLGGTVTFGRTYFVEVVDYSFGTGSYCCSYITPQFSGQVFYLP